MRLRDFATLIILALAASQSPASASTYHLALDTLYVVTGDPLTVDVDFTVPDSGVVLEAAHGTINGSAIKHFSQNSYCDEESRNIFGAVEPSAFFSFEEQNGVISTLSGSDSIDHAFYKSGADADGLPLDTGFAKLVITPVPLPASASLLGASLLALGAAGYGLKRKKPTAAS